MKLTLLPICVVTVVLAGCANHKSLYSWGGYEDQVYSHFKGEAPDQQIIILEQQLFEINKNGTKPPPGFYAHLGLLYSKVGRESDVLEMFEREKTLYPESIVFLTNSLNASKVKK